MVAAYKLHPAASSATESTTKPLLKSDARLLISGNRSNDAAFLPVDWNTPIMISLAQEDGKCPKHLDAPVCIKIASTLPAKQSTLDVIQ